MPNWQDIEYVMAHWYHEGDREAWADLAGIQKDQVALSATQQHMTNTFRGEDRAIMAELQDDVDDLMAYTADELRPQLRLGAADRRGSKSLRR